MVTLYDILKESLLDVENNIDDMDHVVLFDTFNKLYKGDWNLSLFSIVGNNIHNNSFSIDKIRIQNFKEAGYDFFEVYNKLFNWKEFVIDGEISFDFFADMPKIELKDLNLGKCKYLFFNRGKYKIKNITVDTPYIKYGNLTLANIKEINNVSQYPVKIDLSGSPVGKSLSKIYMSKGESKCIEEWVNKILPKFNFDIDYATIHFISGRSRIQISKVNNEWKITR